tara:strand:- start:3140 stop:4687 length:1548 start_codon:yes stop_codon:yes gene_type:complete
LSKYYFDKKASDKAIGFIETFITHTKGEKAGESLILEDWQKKIISNLFGMKIKENGLRKYRTCYIQVPRKNGKTTLCAAIGLYMLFADRERGGEIYASAGDRNQANIIFDIAKQMILNNPELSKRGKVFRNSIINESKGNFFKAISSDSSTKHGFNASCILMDEMHVQKNRDLWDTLLTSTGARREPLCIAITTAGYDKQSICYELYDYACKVRDGSIEDESFYPVIYEAKDNDNIDCEKVWKKCNPNYGVSLRKEYMIRESQRAKDVPSYLNTFKRLMLNLWTDSLSVFIPNEDWMKCNYNINLEDLNGLECWGGLDLASTRDISALVLIFKLKEKFFILPHLFVPRENAKKRSNRDKVDYLTWINQDHIIPTEGDVQDYEFIKQKIRELGSKYRIQSIAYDRWNASQLVIDLMNNEGVNMSPFGQGFVSMSAPTKEFEKLVLSKQLMHNNNPVMNWMLSNVAIQEDPAGNIKVAKNKSREKVDGIVATIMALGEYMTADGVDSVYDNRGLLIL